MISDRGDISGPPEGGSNQDPKPQLYELADHEVAAPPLPGVVSVAPDVDSLIDAVAADLVIHAENCVRLFGDFHLALSGGSTPEPLYERLMYDPNYRRLPWRRTQLWIVDERCVPFDDARSNFRMIRELIVDHSDIPPTQVHPIFAEAEDADVAYEQKLREILSWREKGQDRLDYVLLGLGGDGHTASLFPHSPALHEPERLVCCIEHALADPPRRVTMTFNLINAARFIGIMVSGKSKAEAIQRLAHSDGSVEELPIKGIDPLQGELKWYLDAEACGEATG